MATSAQPQLLFLEDQASVGVLDLFPSVWGAAECLSSPNPFDRNSALDQLLQINAPRLSPLIAYLVSTRLTDPDSKLRARVVETLVAVLSPDEDGRPAPEEVRGHLLLELSHLRQRQIYAIVQVAVEQPEMKDHVAKLLNANPYAGNHLAEILADRVNPVPLRRLAAFFIGQVGFLDALPTLKRLANRLESRQNGQQTMTFAPPLDTGEAELLPVIQEAISLLTAP